MKKGFTLVEVMIVVAIMGLLAAVGIPSFKAALVCDQFNKHLNDPTLPYAKNCALSDHDKLHLSLIQNGKRYCGMPTCSLSKTCAALIDSKYDTMLEAGKIITRIDNKTISSESVVTNYITVAVTNYVEQAKRPSTDTEFKTIDFEFHCQ